MKSKIVIVHGAQWGDEGKGKLTDYFNSLFSCNYESLSTLLKNGKCSDVPKRPVCVRFNGGSNAGHTIKIGDIKYHTHVLPSGIVSANVLNIMASGMVIGIDSLMTELTDMKTKGIDWNGRLLISNRAHVTFTAHKKIDSEGGGKIGTTGQGVGPTYSDKAKRAGIRMGQLLQPDWKAQVTKLYNDCFSKYREWLQYDIDLIESNYELLQACICDTSMKLDEYIDESNIVFEGANAGMLCIDYGTYPFVTSSHCNIAGMYGNCGISPSRLYNGKNDIEVVGVMKAYTTRVGNGILPTQFEEEQDMLISKVGKEVGVTTGRRRRCGALDLVQLKYTTRLNQYTHLNITKIDVLNVLDKVRVCVEYRDVDGNTINEYPFDEQSMKYVIPVYKIFPGWKNYDITNAEKFEDLHPNIKLYIHFIETYLGIPVKYINTGASRIEMIVKNNDTHVDESLYPLSPLDGRYSEYVVELKPYFSEFSYIKQRVIVELKYLEKLCNVIDVDIKLPENYIEFTHKDFSRIKDIEKITKHDVKAIEYFLREYLSKVCATQNYDHLIHIGLTSQDINSVAYSYNLQFATKCITSTIEQTIQCIKKLKLRSPHNILARTHAQPAVPMKFSSFLEYHISRLSKWCYELEHHKFTAKFGGAVGNHMDLKISYPFVDWDKFSDEFVSEFDLTRTTFTSQIDSYDSISVCASILVGVLTALSDFITNIEVYISMDYFTMEINSTETGSSVMPQKVNPIELENALGHIHLAINMAGAYIKDLPRSLLQRDLKDSSMLRYMGMLYGMVMIAMKYTTNGINKLALNKEKVKQELEGRYEIVTSRVQTFLRSRGVKDSYEKLKDISRGKKVTRDMLIDVMKNEGITDDEIAGFTWFDPTVCYD